MSIQERYQRAPTANPRQPVGPVLVSAARSSPALSSPARSGPHCLRGRSGPQRRRSRPGPALPALPFRPALVSAAVPARTALCGRSGTHCLCGRSGPHCLCGRSGTHCLCSLFRPATATAAVAARAASAAVPPVPTAAASPAFALSTTVSPHNGSSRRSRGLTKTSQPRRDEMHSFHASFHQLPGGDVTGSNRHGHRRSGSVSTRRARRGEIDLAIPGYPDGPSTGTFGGHGHARASGRKTKHTRSRPPLPDEDRTCVDLQKVRPVCSLSVHLAPLRCAGRQR